VYAKQISVSLRIWRSGVFRMAEGFQWNLGDIFDALGDTVASGHPALLHEDRVVTWAQLTARSNNIAQSLINRGAQPQDKVAFYLVNCPEYVELSVACLKARLVHVNVNFRYLEDELHYIFDNSDAKFVFYSSQFADRLAAIKARCTKATHFIEVNENADSSVIKNDFAENYESLASIGDGAKLSITRSPEDMVFIYTGGTTGMPKGVMWEQGNLWHALGGGKNHPCTKGKIVKDINALVGCVKEFKGPSQMIACPLMHGTGFFSAMTSLTGGGTIVTMPVQGLDPELIWQTTQDKKVKSIVIVGDAFAKPMLDALNKNRESISLEKWNLDSLRTIVSSGVMWSLETKQGLLKHIPKLMCVDTFGSSEAIGFGTSVASVDGGVKTARFTIGENCKVFTEDHREVIPGSDEKGFIARTGPIPSGYYKDPEKSDKTFPLINGKRYSIPGDWCTVDTEGVIHLLGRGSACINTAGEKVYPEEVEEALKKHESIQDALVVGIEDDKWGMAVTAILELRENTALEKDSLHAHVKELLAGYKAPKHYVCVDKMFRAPNGKADYKSAKAFALQMLS
jgi:fatty-acyl-CoA synthase